MEIIELFSNNSNALKDYRADFFASLNISNYSENNIIFNIIFQNIISFKQEKAIVFFWNHFKQNLTLALIYCSTFHLICV